MFTIAEMARKLGVPERTVRHRATALAALLHPTVQDRARLYPKGDLDILREAGSLYARGGTTAQVLDALGGRFLDAATPATAATAATGEALAITTFGNGGGNGGNVAALAMMGEFADTMKRIAEVLEGMAKRDAERDALATQVASLTDLVGTLSDQVEKRKAKKAKKKKSKGRHKGKKAKARQGASQDAPRPAKRKAPAPTPKAKGSRFKEREAKRGRGRR